MKLRLQWSSYLQFNLKQPFAVTRIKFLDDVKKVAKDASGFLDSFFIITETLSDFSEDFLASFSDVSQINSSDNNGKISSEYRVEAFG